MRFLLDESADARLVPFLRARGDDVTRIAADYPAGIPDYQVLACAVQEDRVLITADRDFGDLIVRQQLEHCGVILFRLGDFAEIDLWVERLVHVLSHHDAALSDLIVVTRQQVRVRTIGRPSGRPA